MSKADWTVGVVPRLGNAPGYDVFCHREGVVAAQPAGQIVPGAGRFEGKWLAYFAGGGNQSFGTAASAAAAVVKTVTHHPCGVCVVSPPGAVSWGCVCEMTPEEIDADAAEFARIHD